ncbi:Transcriptional regulator [Stigmatella aurantiaca DW4/3-1]|uniref:Transcriptional regulator n=1 Tax=Stigmatella aurantiaca (strain DW4/3-1) TaxID=378806 RepID=E3FU32_STIAD|nr:Transcriptional regulator [Stigmatella aurantiaca DW4/3-1]
MVRWPYLKQGGGRTLCFELAEAARWVEHPSRWAELEFALLRQAARAVERPGQALLLQSLERSYRGMARWLWPHLNAQATRQWALCALHALAGKDAQPLRQELPALLQASDAHLLASLPPPQEPRESSRPPLCADTVPSHPTPEDEDATARVSEAKGPNLSACPTGSSQRPPTGGHPPEAPGAPLMTHFNRRSFLTMAASAAFGRPWPRRKTPKSANGTRTSTPS